MVVSIIMLVLAVVATGLILFFTIRDPDERIGLIFLGLLTLPMIVGSIMGLCHLNAFTGNFNDVNLYLISLVNWGACLLYEAAFIAALCGLIAFCCILGLA